MTDRGHTDYDPAAEPDVHEVSADELGVDDDPGLDPAREHDEEPGWSAEAVHEEADADPDDFYVMADADEGDPDALARREREMRERGR